MPRPDHILCIADIEGLPDGARATEAWCGRTLERFEPCFQDVDHAALNGRSEGRLVACDSCVREVVNALRNGMEA